MFRIGQLVGTEDEDCNNACDEHEFQVWALTILADRCRSDIHRALAAGYGSDAKLYEAMWHSNHDAGKAPERKGDEWEVTDPNSAAFEFVLGGFRR